MANGKIRIGISRCLLGENVRYDGGNKLDKYLREQLDSSVNWVGICPEVECGLAVPREAMCLTGIPDDARLISISTGKELTCLMADYCRKKIAQLQEMDLAGFIFKSKSPSCGLLVHLCDRRGKKSAMVTSGLFARAFKEKFPTIPCAEEIDLHTPEKLAHFLALAKK